MKKLGLALSVLVFVLCACAALGAQMTPEDSGTTGCSTAVLVVDVQNAYVPAHGLLTADSADLVTRLVAVLAEARAAGIPIVYIKQIEQRFANGNPLGEIVAAIAPFEGDPVIWKPTGDAFSSTNLDGLLAGMGVHRVLITGLATHGCVNETVFGALGLHYETWIVADAHADAGGPGLESYYNTSWPAYGVHVVASTDTDFALFGCAAPTAP
jgi:nicotinamidase-related amidase